MSIVGVLRHPVTGVPIPEGLKLYESLSSTTNVILLADEPKSELYSADLDRWFTLHGLVHHSALWYPREYWSTLDQVNELRFMGHALLFIVLSDPVPAKDLLNAGYSVILYTHAAYAHPEWRPDADSPVRAWDSLAAQVAANAEQRAADKRGEDNAT